MSARTTTVKPTIRLFRLLIGSILVTLLLLYAGMVVLLYQNQDRLVYVPSHELGATPAIGGLAYEDVWIDTDDGERLHGWFVPSEQATGTVLFFHGNGGNIASYLDRVGMFHRLGLHTLIIDYRGYGQSSGTPDENGIYLDAAAAWRELVENRGIPPEEIVVVGYSFGGAVAVWTAATYHPHALVLESTFTSLPDVGAEQYPFLPVHLLMHARYNSLERMPLVQVPVLIIHSHDDLLIPPHHAQELFAAANPPKAFLEIHGGHGDGFAQSQQIIETKIQTFLAEHSDHMVVHPDL